MNRTPIKRTAQGVEVVRWVDGWPRSTTISANGQDIRLHGAEQARALYWALGEVIEGDKEDD